MGGRRNPAGVKGAGGSGCGARGWRQGQAKYMHTKYRPIGGRRGACRAWPGFETTRRAKLAARTASGRAGPAAVGDQAAGPEGTRNTGGAHQVPPDGRLPQPRRCEGRRRTGLRCPWVAAGPGRASRRRAEPKARGADGERAGRRPRAHKAARRANCLYSPPTPGSGRPV